jgi:hypothetical protein
MASSYNELIPMVKELRNIVDGLQFLINKDRNEVIPNTVVNTTFKPIVHPPLRPQESPFSITDPRNPNYRDPKRKPSKYDRSRDNRDTVSKYDRNKDRNMERKVGMNNTGRNNVRNDSKQTKVVKPPKVKEFVCTSENCNEKFNMWKDMRGHLKENHDIDKPKYKLYKTPTVNLNSKNNNIPKTSDSETSDKPKNDSENDSKIEIDSKNEIEYVELKI